MSPDVRRLLLFAWLVVLWILLWRDVSVANLLGGAAVALVVTLAYPLSAARDSHHQLHVGRLLSFLGYFVWQLLTSNLVVARAVLSPRSKVTTGILAVPLPDCSDLVTTVIANSVSLTPGTLTVEVRRRPRTIYVHVLHLQDIEEVREGVHEMARRVLRSLTTEDMQKTFETAIAEARDVPSVPAPDETASTPGNEEERE